MKFEITFEHLIMLVAILYILMFVIKTKERFDQAQEKQEEKKQKIVVRAVIFFLKIKYSKMKRKKK